MFISKGEYNIKPEKYDELVDFTQSLIPELRGIKGARQLILIRTGNDTAMTIASYDSEEDANAATSKVQQMFSRMAEFLTAPPVRNLYEAVVYEQF